MRAVRRWAETLRILIMEKVDVDGKQRTCLHQYENVYD